MIETLAVVEYEHAKGCVTAGLVLWGDGNNDNDRVIEAAPILHYMKKGKWTRSRVRSYCREKGWKISVVHQIERSAP